MSRAPKPPGESNETKLREQFVQKLMSDCRHFTGASRSPCKAGIDYRTLVGGDDVGWMTRLPCIRAFEPDARFPVVECEQRAVLTREEAIVEADRKLERMEQFRKAHAAAKFDAAGKGLRKGHGGEGEILCPLCGSKLYYTVASLNGHMWGHCTTKGCVSWME